MPIQLFEHPLSPYARKVKIVLYEKGIPFERVYVAPLTLRATDAGFDAFAAASPRLEVPCIVDGDFRCFDSTIIVDYLDEKWPDPPMLPAKPEDRARARMVEELCDTAIEAINWGMMEIRFFKRAEGAQAEQMIARAGTQLERIWDYLDPQLEGRPWFSGERFGRADAALIGHVVSAGLFGFALADRHARLRDWSVRSLAVEGVKRDQADLAEFMGGDGLRSMRKGPFKRQYRDHRLEWMLKTGGLDIVQRGLDKETIQFSSFP
ncbi:MAG: glutathione S-transferase family protein [Polyangiaceae bacterium]